MERAKPCWKNRPRVAVPSARARPAQPVSRSLRDPREGIVAASEGDAPIEWSRVTFVRPEESGEEVFVLDNGDVYSETKSNPYFKLDRNDLVKITDSMTLIRKSGGRTQVERLDCSAASTATRCRGLAAYR